MITEHSTPPTPGLPHTYRTAPNDRHKGVYPAVIFVPIRDPKRGRTVFAKLEQASFDALPETARSRAWFLVKDGTARDDDTRFSVRVGYKGEQVSVARLVMRARPGEFVRCLSRDRLDLRTSNLRLKTGPLGRRSKRHDLALVSRIDCPTP